VGFPHRQSPRRPDVVDGIFPRGGDMLHEGERAPFDSRKGVRSSSEIEFGRGGELTPERALSAVSQL
jgi:hypothetical protein